MGSLPTMRSDLFLCLRLLVEHWCHMQLHRLCKSLLFAREWWKIHVVYSVTMLRSVMRLLRQVNEAISAASIYG